MSKLGYRERCLAQKINSCNVCGTGDGLVVHHINGEQDDNRLENLVPLCRSCHTKVHTTPEPDGTIGWLQAKLPETLIRDTGGGGAINRPSVVMSVGLLKKVDDARHSTTPRSKWFRKAARNQLLIGEIEDNNAGLADDWVEQALYSYIERERKRTIEA